MLDVERWAEIRRMHYGQKIAIREIARRTGHDRQTVRRALRSDKPPQYQRTQRPSKLDPFKEEIHRLLREEPKLPAVRMRELIEPLGFDGAQTIVNEYLREVRPLFAPARTFQRTLYRPGEICQFDLWEPSAHVPVGHGQTRRAWVVVCCLGYSRFGSAALIFSKEAPDILSGVARCLWALGGLPKTLVWDREGALHARSGRPTDIYAAFCGQLRVGWHFCQARDPQAKGAVERLQGFMETNFEPGRAFVNALDYQLQLDDWFASKANFRTHRTLRERPAERLSAEQEAMAPLPEAVPDTDRRFVTRVLPDPYLRHDRNDYSLDPTLVGQRVEVRISQQSITAAALNSGQSACSHTRSFAQHLTITDPTHEQTLATRRTQRRSPQIEVQLRPLDRYDALIPA